jgi:hypothetical protein
MASSRNSVTQRGDRPVIISSKTCNQSMKNMSFKKEIRSLEGTVGLFIPYNGADQKVDLMFHEVSPFAVTMR